MQHAINQVSQILTYNGLAPETRAACYFDLSRTPIKGIIIDPEGDENGIDIKFDEESAIRKYYSFFIENSQQFSNNIRYGGYEFLTTPVGVPQLFFGFDKRLLELKPSEILSKGLYNDDGFFPTNDNLPFREVSLGLDGIILIDGTLNSYNL
ncbi:hypothetical protein [Pedobacter sp. UBA5917]|jgi:hypothetical protein|uniref:hypothetical protein n=1 Tax=Pedobacter sp. UBA5917 TaxID=1947061 RepID=UPI0025D699C0|nr:hypothetical protein [Pedobacter sp. UBA5917]